MVSKKGCNSFHVQYRAQVDLASVEVRFQHLSVNAEVAVGARGEPTVLNSYRNKFEVDGDYCVCLLSTRTSSSLVVIL